MRYLIIFKLKAMDVLAMKGLVASLFLMPLLFGWIAGAANIANVAPDIRLALTDQDQTDASNQLIGRLLLNGWDITVTDEQEAARMMVRNQIDGLVTVEAGYERSLADLDESYLYYEPAEGSLVTTVVREAIAAAVLPAHAEEVLLQRVRRRYAHIGKDIPNHLDQDFRTAMSEYASGKASLRIDYIGRIHTEPALTFVISDYAMEVFFLSIYAILGGLTLAGGGFRRRLASTNKGIAADYFSTLAALFCLGSLQIVLYSTVMSLAMQSVLRMQDLLYLMLFLLMMLGISQLFQLISQNIRLYLSLLTVLLLSIAGGCFFPLSELLMRSVGQFTPHGWTLGMIRGYPALPVFYPVALSVILILFGYYLQKYKAAGSVAESGVIQA